MNEHTRRVEEIRVFAEGTWPDGKPHIREGVESFTRDLLAAYDDLAAERDRLKAALQDGIEATAIRGRAADAHAQRADRAEGLVLSFADVIERLAERGIIGATMSLPVREYVAELRGRQRTEGA